MVDRWKVEAILTRRFPGVSEQQIAAAVNALMGLGDEWEEVGDSSHVRVESLVPHRPGSLRPIENDSEFRLFRRRIA